ncbi:MAG: hypothetical protein NVV63_01575 [Opitutus sp.]|nr:hypothetical protein [Opitutus sp.]
MHSPRSTLRGRRGSALILAMFLVVVFGLLTASMLKYSGAERRSNERERLILRARNMAENVALYASEQITVKLYRLRNLATRKFATGTNQIYLPPDDVLTTSFSGPTDVAVSAGLVSNTPLALVTDTTSSNHGLQVATGNVSILAKSTMTHPSIGSVTAYARQELQVTEIPLFQFAIFYNQDLEFSPGADMVIAGPVHANGNLIARGQTGFSNTVQFTDRVTASGGFYANTAHRGATYSDTDAADNGPGGTGPLNFQNPAGTVTNIKSSSGVWRDHKFGNASESATSLNQFKTFATSTYGGNLRTSVHGATPLVLPGIDSDAESNSGRTIIEAPSAADSAGVKQTKFSRRAGLYIIVNPDNETRSGVLPDGATVSMPAYSYRCWLNTVSHDGSNSYTEVVLPGQPSYGANNATQNDLPNRFTDKTAIGINQVLRIPLSGRSTDAPISGWLADTSLKTGYATTPPSGTAQLTNGTTIIPDAFFYDLRRADNSLGHPFNRSAANPFKPRPIAKIDFDLIRFRLTVERSVNGAATSSSIYYPSVPTNSTQWSAFIFNPSATRTSYGLGPTTQPSPYNTFPTSGGVITSDPFRIYYTNGTAVPASELVSTSGSSPWFDGITVYVNSVDAENRTRTAGVLNRQDSGVRLWNGRGRVISLDPSTYSGRTGFSFATNDAAYIVGHFNADGSINSNSNSTGNGGYSARYPDNADEMLCAVMADSITILSQPTFSNPSGTTYRQTSGWSDSLSGHRRDDGSSFAWSSSWATSNPSGSNRQDGVNTALTPAAMPNLSYAVSGGNNRQQKFSPVVTEISTCLLTGIVPTDSHQSSGGVHNYPRLLENWSGTGLYIRGSMVAMFSSVIGTEPWSIRLYTGAGRYWGLHQSLRNANHDVPLEPTLLNAQRLHYTELSATEYAAEKAAIEALAD